MTKTMESIERVKQQIKDAQNLREEIIEQSTAKKLERVNDELSSLRESLHSLERVASSAVSTAQPSEKESDLWEQIKENMEQEQAILHRVGIVPEKYVRPDAVEHFQKDILERRRKLDEQVVGLRGNQRMGERYRAENNALITEERAFPVKIKPLCLAGQKIHQLRERRAELSAERDRLKSERESKILASV